MDRNHLNRSNFTINVVVNIEAIWVVLRVNFGDEVFEADKIISI